MKKYVLYIIVAVLSLLLLFSIKEIKDLNSDLNKEKITNQALLTDNERLVIGLNKSTFKNLKGDSIITNLNNTIDSLNIKLKNVNTGGYIYTEIHDTLVLVDSRLETIELDTTLGDSWVSSRLILDSCKLQVIPCFVSEKYIIFAREKQTVNPPRKYWIGRLFQKKQWVDIVDVVEKNPYVTKSCQRFYNIEK